MQPLVEATLLRDEENIERAKREKYESAKQTEKENSEERKPLVKATFIQKIKEAVVSMNKLAKN